MHDTRFFGVIRSVGDRGFVVDRDDDQGRAFIPEREARAAGDLAVGDRVSFGLHPGGMAHDVTLARRARRLTASNGDGNSYARC
jgi:hypothetical protein